MNFVFVSPNFPDSYWKWCARLKERGVNVLGIGDTPYDNLSWELKDALAEYYWVPSLEDYDEVFRGLAFLSWKHGKIDWIESNNEYWLTTDARLRDDFNVKTGPSFETIAKWQSKAEMKPLYAAAGVPTARQIVAGTAEDALEFAKEVGWPLFAKPERGMGSGGTSKLADAAAVKAFFEQAPDESYVLEQYVTGDICSYDAIIDDNSEPVFENQEEFPPSMAQVVAEQLDMSYYSRPKVDAKLAKLGRATVKSFGIRNRFVHMEFFRLTKDHPGLGKTGDYVGLEVNVRPPGGSTPEIIGFAHSCDIYGIWADTILGSAPKELQTDDAFGIYVGRRDIHSYAYSHEEIMERYAEKLVMVERVPAALADDLGDMAYVARIKTKRAVETFKDYVLKRADDAS